MFLCLVVHFLFQERRRLAINNAKRQWETMQGSLISNTSKMAKGPAVRELYANHVGSLPISGDIFACHSAQYEESLGVTR